jgi:hypothetical protein
MNPGDELPAPGFDYPQVPMGPVDGENFEDAWDHEIEHDASPGHLLARRLVRIDEDIDRGLSTPFSGPQTSVRCLALPSFWKQFQALNPDQRSLGERTFSDWCEDPWREDLELVELKADLWLLQLPALSSRHRALARFRHEGYHWFFLGTREDYQDFRKPGP